MRRFDDETLMAFVDGELDAGTADAVARAAAADADVAARVRAFQDSAIMVRAAFADVVDEPVPDRLLRAARGTAAEGDAAATNVVAFRKRSVVRQWIALPIAASLVALLVGAGGGYWAGKRPNAVGPAETASVSGLVDNLAGYYDLYTYPTSGGSEPQQLAMADLQTDEREGLQTWLSRRLDRETKVPDLSNFGYSLRGGRIVISEGRPAGQIIYENPQERQPIAIYVGTTNKRDAKLTLDQRKDVNVAYWRREGRTIAVFGKTDKTMIRDIANKVGEGGGI
ncbi:MAG: hypothetical protein IT561_11195 [Alphaproteobacteria bacterium]|nr:hypothetical protein [Alphaproteobacteria bacterium]